MANDLTTLANVKAFLQKTDAGWDTLIASEITRASAVIMRYCEREFVPATSGATRTFDAEIIREGWLDLAPYDLRALTSIRIDSDASTPTTLTVDEWRLFPQPAPDGVYTAVRLQPFTATVTRVPWRNRQLSITGDWGFSAIPVDVEQACIVTVAIWLRRDVSVFSNVMNLDEQRVERPQTIPGGARHILDMYKRMGQG